MATTVEAQPGWLDADGLAEVRGRVPMVYVEAVPVRVDHLGRITRVGFLLRAQADGTLSREIVSGRVLFGETVREALWRHLTKDLGPEADPQLPVGASPFTVAEYFPAEGRGDAFDARQHAVALCYVVPIDGEAAPSQDSLDFAWLTPEEVGATDVAAELSPGHARLVRRALAHCGVSA